MNKSDMNKYSYMKYIELVLNCKRNLKFKSVQICQNSEFEMSEIREKVHNYY